MSVQIQLRVAPEIASNIDLIKDVLVKEHGVSLAELKNIKVDKRSIDARQKQIKYNITVSIFTSTEEISEPVYLPNYPNVTNQKEVVVVGAGPAGLFAALQLIELGLKPIIVERGKNIKDRRRDLKAINQEGIVNPESNYCFGEGGAGTYSDGKLYTRSKKRGDVNRILELLVGFGASDDILVDAHPHIGTNKLPKIIEQIRALIIAHGGVIRFNTKLTDILLSGNQISGVQVNHNESIKTDVVLLATGHSARDIYELLVERNILVEAKPFAIGVRVEHPQELIDQIQYKCNSRGEYLPPAPYNIVKQVNDRGVYSFCMCPGGVIAPCATDIGEVVTNGWSPSKRDQATANSGIVVELKISDFKPYAQYGALAGLQFQKQIEQKAWRLAGKTQKVPAQKMVDFTHKKVSQQIPKTSYVPGTTSLELGEVFPYFITDTLRKGFVEFGKSMNGYYTNDAIIHAPESRTSSPVRIPRDMITLEHPQIKGLYPCGEGAGYAGGIISAAIDGEKCAKMICQNIKTNKIIQTNY